MTNVVFSFINNGAIDFVSATFFLLGATIVFFVSHLFANMFVLFICIFFKRTMCLCIYLKVQMLTSAEYDDAQRKRDIALMDSMISGWRRDRGEAIAGAAGGGGGGAAVSSAAVRSKSKKKKNKQKRKKKT